jgi:hypothetical protein
LEPGLDDRAFYLLTATPEIETGAKDHFIDDRWIIEYYQRNSAKRNFDRVSYG